MWKKIALGLGVLLAVLLVAVAVQPSEFRVERSITIAAPPSVPYGLVEDFRAWNKWSPWEELDPNMKREYSGAPKGAGAQYAWVGQDEVGEGRMTIERAAEERELEIKLEFIKPFPATNDTVFTFAPEASGTKVNWAMSGKNDFLGKAFCLFMDMDKMVGGDFEKGLEKLKTLSEKSAP